MHAHVTLIHSTDTVTFIHSTETQTDTFTQYKLTWDSNWQPRALQAALPSS